MVELKNLLARNQELSTRLQKASRDASTLNEQLLRKIGADLHDGPARLVAYASMRIESEALLNGAPKSLLRAAGAICPSRIRSASTALSRKH